MYLYVLKLYEFEYESIKTKKRNSDDIRIHTITIVGRWELRTTSGDSMYQGGPAAACCTFKRNSSAFGPTKSASVICGYRCNTSTYRRYVFTFLFSTIKTICEKTAEPVRYLWNIVAYVAHELRNHTLARQCECRKGDDASQWRSPKFDPHHAQTP